MHTMSCSEGRILAHARLSVDEYQAVDPYEGDEASKRRLAGRGSEYSECLVGKSQKEDHNSAQIPGVEPMFKKQQPGASSVVAPDTRSSSHSWRLPMNTVPVLDMQSSFTAHRV